MTNQGELLDDSTLINAFDEAISKYKRMHGRGHQSSLEKEDEAEKISIDIEESKQSLVDDENGIGKRDYLQADVTQIEKIPLGSDESFLNLSEGNLNTETDNYTRLLNEYYKIEEQRQTILQQLQQFGNLSCQVSVPDTQYDGYPSQDGYGSSSCCPYSGQCFMAPCSYGGTCEYGETCDGTTGIPSTYSQADDVTKTGTEIPSSYAQADDVTKTGTDPAASDTCIKHINEKGEETIGQVTETSRSRTDLSTVLEAWFSAGFHTGKYEAEQVNIRKGQ